MIHDAFRVAAILHNRLLRYDGFDKFDWESMDPDGEEEGTVNNTSIIIPACDDSTDELDGTIDELPMPEDLTTNTQVTALVSAVPTIVAVPPNSVEPSQADVADAEEVYNPIFCQVPTELL